MNKYEKLIKSTEEEYNKEYEKYSSDIRELKYKCKQAVQEYNDQIAVINSIRHELRAEINALYKFLKSFGNVGKRITPFEYVTEASKFSDMDKKHDTLNLDRKDDKNSVFFTSAKISVAFFAPMAIPAIVIGEACAKRSKAKEHYQKLLEAYEGQKTEWENHKLKCRDQIALYKTATSIANIYRSLIATVKDAIDETIIPELTGIEAFLAADAIKNCIISDMDPEEAVVSSIAEYKGTLFDGHYVFVMNSFDYYTIISKFFTEPILTNIISDNKITGEEQEAFDLKVSQIEKQTQKLAETAVFEGRIK